MTARFTPASREAARAWLEDVAGSINDAKDDLERGKRLELYRASLAYYFPRIEDGSDVVFYREHVAIFTRHGGRL